MKIERLGIVGAGVMGSGIARHWCAHRYDTTLVDISTGALARVPPAPRLTKTTDLDALSACDLVLEAVYEDVAAKSEVLSRVSSDGVIATNTSSLTVASLAPAVGNRSRFLALHYNNPAETNPVVEVVPGDATDRAVADACEDFLRRTGKRAIRCRDTAGFALNRQSLPYINEAGRLLDEGLGTPASIDAAAKRALGVGLGPFAVMNLVGTRTMAAAIQNLAPHGPLYEPARCIRATGETNASWDIGGDEEPAAGVEERVLGSVFVPALEIVGSGIATADDLDFICTEALGYPKGSVTMMRELRTDELERIVSSTCTRVGMEAPPTALP